MKARIDSRVLSTNHTRLETVIPLETPFVLIVDPANTCNLRCRYCPSGDPALIRDTKRRQGLLDFALFEKLIADLDEFSTPVKTLRLYKEGEPLLNPRFADMVRLAKQSSKVMRVDTTTNGLLLDPKRNLEIIAAGLDRINISVNGVNDEQYQHFCKTRVDFSRLVDNIRHFHEHKDQCEVYVKGIKENLSPEDQAKFFDIFGNISDLIFMEHLSPAWPEFTFDGMDMEFAAGNYGQEIRERQVCPNLFYTMVINSDGSVSLCVGDWARKLVVGDIARSSLRDIWLGPALDAHRVAHLEGRRKENPFCEACQVMSHGTLENIDHAAPELLKKYRK